MWGGPLLAFPALSLAFGVCVWRRRDTLLLYTLPAFGLIMFYAPTANFKERCGTACAPDGPFLWHRRLRNLVPGTTPGDKKRGLIGPCSRNWRRWRGIYAGPDFTRNS